MLDDTAEEEPVVPEAPNTGAFTKQGEASTEAAAMAVLFAAAVAAIALLGYAAKVKRA